MDKSSDKCDKESYEREKPREEVDCQDKYEKPCKRETSRDRSDKKEEDESRDRRRRRVDTVLRCKSTGIRINGTLVIVAKDVDTGSHIAFISEEVGRFAPEFSPQSHGQVDQWTAEDRRHVQV